MWSNSCLVFDKLYILVLVLGLVVSVLINTVCKKKRKEWMKVQTVSSHVWDSRLYTTSVVAKKKYFYLDYFHILDIRRVQ